MDTGVSPRDDGGIRFTRAEPGFVTASGATSRPTTHCVLTAALGHFCATGHRIFGMRP